MRINLKIGLFICAALLGGQGQPSAAPTLTSPQTLPTGLSPSYILAFRKSPQLTAQRFLDAYDGLAVYGPVIHESVHGHALLHAFIENRQGRGGILAADLNAQGFITRIEFETRSAFSMENADRMAGVFVFDETQEELMTLADAVKFGQDLFEAPIERYLMLFDLNADGYVMRDEVVNAMEAYVREPERVSDEARWNSLRLQGQN